MRVPKLRPSSASWRGRESLPLQVQRWFPRAQGVVTFTCTEVNDARALDELVAALEK